MSRHRQDRTRPRSRRRGPEAHEEYRAAVARARATRAVPRVALTHLRPGDVIDAFVDFLDATGCKRRPAIVVTADAHRVVALRCTTKFRHFTLPLVGWKEAGLAQPTAVDLRPITIWRTDVVRRIGRCAIADLAQLSERGVLGVADSEPR